MGVRLWLKLLNPDISLRKEASSMFSHAFIWFILEYFVASFTFDVKVIEDDALLRGSVGEIEKLFWDIYKPSPKPAALPSVHVEPDANGFY